MLVEAGVAVVTVQHLVALVVGTAEADLAVCLELAVVLILPLVCGWPVALPVFALLIDLVRLEDLVGLVSMSLPEVLEYVRPNQCLVDRL